ncbi:MAG TPA: PEP-CTERM sorting domain-containing protein, partial [Burkholderiales bacterium]|nr:PEP-CTERM sorting domain-containing protein [Burkholderiales bacterium]
SFDLAGAGVVPNTMIYGINFDSATAVDVLLPVTLPSSQFIRFSLLFSTPVATTGRVVFDDQGGDNNGLLLDDVRVAVAIPEPETWGLLLAGLGLLGFAARRRRQ